MSFTTVKPNQLLYTKNPAVELNARLIRMYNSMKVT